jgi:acetylornithine deacetylase/succinyl-diaminopimelate desuccinylase-like protein
MQPEHAQETIEKLWRDDMVDALSEFIRIPAKSPDFDPDWAENGYIDQAVEHTVKWCESQPIEGMQIEVVRLEGRTPVILIDIPGSVDDTVFLYGHLDKQPEASGWSEGMGPWEPVVHDDKLYGRGSADDGYAVYSSIAAIRAVQEQGAAHARCVLLIETCEESGSYDLPAYIDHLADRIGSPSLVVCLDSGAGNYEQMWITSSLRGMAAGTLHVDILTEGVHSGMASGIVPSSFRIARQLISRLEDEATGRILAEALNVEVPEQRHQQLAAVADQLGEGIHASLPWVDGAEPVCETPLERLIARNWRPALAVTGAGGLPALGEAGNVLRPGTSLKLSMRLPPTLDAEGATQCMKDLLERDPPYGARVRFEPETPADGWNAPEFAPWLESACQRASETFFGKPAMFMGEGGSIPFMALLGESFPEAQFLITGVLGPKSNAHGPNEFLHLPYVSKLTAAVASILADHGARER